jgi:hypothetical protein
VDIFGVRIHIPLGVGIGYILLQLAMHLHIAIVDEEVSKILLLETSTTIFLLVGDSVSYAPIFSCAALSSSKSGEWYYTPA